MLQNWLLLLVLLFLCIGLSYGHIDTDDDDDDDDNTGESGVLLAKLIRKAKNPVIELAHEHSSPTSSTTELKRAARKKVREARQQKEIQEALANANRPAPVARESYQAKFTRDTRNETLAPATGLCTTTLFTPGNFNRTGTQCSERAHGPVVFVSKTSAATVQSDSFDGNKDGKDDVQAAWETFLQDTSAAPDSAINGFLQQVRNRASVNGGSIDLVALILTGRTSNGQFATFGPGGRLLFSPCFPVIKSEKYNIDIYGNIQGLPTLFSLHVDYFNFITDTTPGVNDDDLRDDVWVQSTGTFNLTALPFVNPDPAQLDPVTMIGPTVTGLPVGNVKFERCTQFSYFQ